VVLEAHTVPRDECLRTDVCIVGAGAAGITLARALAQQRIEVTLIESGAIESDDETQRLYQGVTSGQPYYPLDQCRLRLFGGTTNEWGGWCRPLDAIDFESREWVPYSGWPFGRADLDRYYARAHEVCGLGACEYEATAGPAGSASLLNRENAAFEHTLFRINPLRFGRAFRRVLERSRHIRLLLNANAVEVVMDATHQRATSVRCATLGGNAFRVECRRVVLAGGGIENARLLLASRSAFPSGIGNQHDLVGRFFSDHVHVPLGLVRARSASEDAFYARHRRVDCVARGGLALTDGFARATRRQGFAVTFHNADDPHDVLSPQTSSSYRSLRYLLTSLGHARSPQHPLRHLRVVAEGLGEAASLTYRRLVPPTARRLTIGARAEQRPHPNNRVTLDGRLDALGMPTVRLDWRLASEDLENIRICRTRLLQELRNAGEQVLTEHSRDDDEWQELIRPGAHHCGTTRMHRAPAQGVVDEHCRVHGVRNVFIAGSSIFPTIGSAPPTLTIVALALRLSDHLATLSVHS
jgi:choline dehydrogenase-like flavoprotein